jgi:hypothetical protein
MSEYLLEEIIPENVEQYLKDEHFHHSLRGCKCVILPISAKDEERVDVGVYKKCLTHNKDCSKTGWELGHYLNRDKASSYGMFKKLASCECGALYKNEYGMCLKCLEEKKPELFKAYKEDARMRQLKSHLFSKFEYYGIPRERWEEKMKDYLENYYLKKGDNFNKLKEFWKK